MIIDTYGPPRYKEINPGIFTIATFPFLFGVMFGDIIHGLLWLIFGSYLCLASDKIKNSNSGLKGMLAGRYFFAMMGFFATYVGFLYNDMTSVMLNLFGSCYDFKKDYVPEDNWVVRSDPECVYPFGIDPIWGKSSNEITYINSFKMKMAVIIGVIHMMFGIFMRGWNNINTKSAIDFIFEFLPMTIFMSAAFVFMDALIIYKWLTDFSTINGNEGVSIITIMINMPMGLMGGGKD